MRVVLVGLFLALSSFSAWAQNGGREITIDGRTLSCGDARIYVNRNLGNPGMAIPQQNKIIVDPGRPGRMSPELKWFIFYHECGHIQGHLDEMDADAYAVEMAIQEGWFTKVVMNQVCRSWGPMNAPASDTHPAPRVRCSAVQQVAASLTPSANVGTVVTSGAGPRPVPVAVANPPVAAPSRQPTSGTQAEFMMEDLPTQASR